MKLIKSKKYGAKETSAIQTDSRFLQRRTSNGISYKLFHSVQRSIHASIHDITQSFPILKINILGWTFICTSSMQLKQGGRNNLHSTQARMIRKNNTKGSPKQPIKSKPDTHFNSFAFSTVTQYTRTFNHTLQPCFSRCSNLQHQDIRFTPEHVCMQILP